MYTFTGDSTSIAASLCSAKQLNSTCSKAYTTFTWLELLVGVYPGLKFFNRSLATKRAVGVLSGTYGIHQVVALAELAVPQLAEVVMVKDTGNLTRRYVLC